MVVCLLLLIHVVLLAWVDLRNSPSMDEVAHVPAGLSHWQMGTFDLYNVNPPLPRLVASLPLVFLHMKTDWSRLGPDSFGRLEFPIGMQFVQDNGQRAFWYFTIASPLVSPESGEPSCATLIPYAESSKKDFPPGVVLAMHASSLSSVSTGNAPERWRPTISSVKFERDPHSFRSWIKDGTEGGFRSGAAPQSTVTRSLSFTTSRNAKCGST
jgi:hypothetical protein